MRLKCAVAGGSKERVTPVCARDAAPSVIYGCTAGLKKGKWLNKWSQGGGERGSSLAYKIGLRDKGKQDREQRKLRRREDSRGEGTSKTLKPGECPEWQD